MFKKGTTVKILYPEYAAGITGKLVIIEDSSKRWIVRLDKNPFQEGKETVYLSLEESDFQVVND